MCRVISFLFSFLETGPFSQVLTVYTRNNLKDGDDDEFIALLVTPPDTDWDVCTPETDTTGSYHLDSRFTMFRLTQQGHSFV
jgi:hypothetical protein